MISWRAGRRLPLAFILLVIAVTSFGTKAAVAVGAITIFPPDHTTFFEAVPGVFTVHGGNLCGGTAIWSESGSMPSGVAFSGDTSTASSTSPTATLAGTPAIGTAGTWTIYISLQSTVSTLICPQVQQTFTLTVSAGSAYIAVTPVRLLDTRNGTGAPAPGRLGPNGSVDLAVCCGPPLADYGAIAVVLNVTVTSTTDVSFLTVFPKGTARPVASNLNWTAGKTIANLVEVRIGFNGLSSTGEVTFYNAKGQTHVIADLEGYFTAPSGSAGGQVALSPARIADTRTGSGQPYAGQHLGPGATLVVQITGAGGVPGTGVSGVILNVTATHTTAASFFTVWPDGVTQPNASNLNWTAGLTIPNRVFVPVGTGGKVDIYNGAGTADVIVDVSGYFTDGTATGQFFTPRDPVRLLDTRSSTHLGPKGARTLTVGGVSGVPHLATAVILNVTVTKTSATSFLTVHPSTTALPNASDLNWTAGQTIPNLVVATLGTTGAISIYNQAGTTDVIVDLLGYFGGAPPALVLNEFETRGAGGTTDCFVEIFNPTANPAQFGGWKLVDRPATVTTDTVLATVPAATTIAAGGYFLFTGTTFSGSVPGGVGNMSFACGYSTIAGGLALRDPDGTLVDSVGYGTGVTNGFVENTATGAPTLSHSDSRSPNATDTNNNSTDFAVSTTITPGAAN
ncbi:MAG TPA: lamin tail domain-containing protein [Candidatus Dormibacteraeota bacterium]|jgi:hypothetical protein